MGYVTIFWHFTDWILSWLTEKMMTRSLIKLVKLLWISLSVSFQAELNEVLDDDDEQTPAPTPPAVTPPAAKASVTSHSAPPAAPSGASGVESRLLERIDMYVTAISNAKAAGETSKVRRYDRGLKVKWASYIWVLHLRLLKGVNLSLWKLIPVIFVLEQ